MVDSQFFLECEVPTNAQYDDLEETCFFEGFADGLRACLFPDEPESPADTYSLVELLELAKIQVVVNIYNTNTYVKLETGMSRTTNNKTAIMNFIGLDIQQNPYYAAIVYPWATTYYNVLYNLQIEKDYAVYTFPKEDLVLSGFGLTIRCWMGGSTFTPGCAWSLE